MTAPVIGSTNTKVCTGEYMISDGNGLGLRDTWFPRILDEQFLKSTKDGKISIAPDPVVMIDGDLTWNNNSEDRVAVHVLVHRAPRSIIAQNPSTVIITDAWSKQIGPNPQAERPTVVADAFGGRLQIDRQSVARDQIQFARWYLNSDETQSYVPIGVVPPHQSFHFRYMAFVQTPGTWIVPSEFEPRWEANANWTRLIAMGGPVGA